MQFAKVFEYKKWANSQLLDFGERQFSKLPENDGIFFVRILNHTTIVDSLFTSRILGEPEKYTADNTVETPSFSELRERMAHNDTRLVQYAMSASKDELDKVIQFNFVDGDIGTMSVEEVLFHLLTHGNNHRGMASRVLAENNLERPKDTYTRYLHLAEPTRRGSAVLKEK